VGQKFTCVYVRVIAEGDRGRNLFTANRSFASLEQRERAQWDPNEIKKLSTALSFLHPRLFPRPLFIPGAFPFSRHSRETLLVRISHSMFWKETVLRCRYRTPKSSSGNAPPDNGARDTARLHFPSNYQRLGGTEKGEKKDKRYSGHYGLSLAINKIENYPKECRCHRNGCTIEIML